MLCRMIGSSVSSEAANKGKAAFLFPAGVTSPSNGTPPSITNLSMFVSLENRFLEEPCEGFLKGMFAPIQPSQGYFYQALRHLRTLQLTYMKLQVIFAPRFRL